MNPSMDSITGRGRVAYGSDGHRIGAIVRVVGDGRSQHPEWLIVDPSPYGTAVRVVPLHGVVCRGHRVVVDFDRETIAGAPPVAVDGDVLSRRAAAELRRYYQLDGDYSSWQPG